MPTAHPPLLPLLPHTRDGLEGYTFASISLWQKVLPTHQHSALDGVEPHRPEHVPELRGVDHARAVRVEQHVLPLQVLQPHLPDFLLQLRVNLLRTRAWRWGEGRGIQELVVSQYHKMSNTKRAPFNPGECACGARATGLGWC